jgi:F-box/WD-40 domain protein MET30
LSNVHHLSSPVKTRLISSSQLSHLSDQLNEIIRVDPFSLLPREVNLRILGYLDAISLGRAAQVSKTWKALADDDLLWRRMCGQHIDRKCEKCGWGLPLLERRRLKVELKDFSPAAAMGVGGHEDHHHHHEHDHEHRHGDGATSGTGEPGDKILASKVITRTEALGGMNRSRAGAVTCDPVAPPSMSLNNSITNLKRPAQISPTASPSKKPKMDGSDSECDEKALVPANSALGVNSLPRAVRLTRPWKSVYCERLLVERNWRKGRCTTKTLRVSRESESFAYADLRLC